MAFKVGVICKNCGQRVEMEEEYVQGVAATEMAAALYGPIAKSPKYSGNVAWQRTLTCGYPDCGKTHESKRDDLVLYEG